MRSSCFITKIIEKSAFSKKKNALKGRDLIKIIVCNASSRTIFRKIQFHLTANVEVMNPMTDNDNDFLVLCLDLC